MKTPSTSVSKRRVLAPHLRIVCQTRARAHISIRAYSLKQNTLRMSIFCGIRALTNRVDRYMVLCLHSVSMSYPALQTHVGAINSKKKLHTSHRSLSARTAAPEQAIQPCGGKKPTVERGVMIIKISSVG